MLFPSPTYPSPPLCPAPASPQFSEPLFLSSICAFFQVAFITDLYLRFRKFCLEEGGVMRTTPKAIYEVREGCTGSIGRRLLSITKLYFNQFFVLLSLTRAVFAQAYKNEWMYWDLVSCFPSYYLALFLGAPQSTASLFLSLQILRVVRYFDYWSFIDLYLTKRHIGKNPAVMEVSKIVILIMILVSILACVLIQIGCSNHDPVLGCLNEDSWMTNPNINVEQEGALSQLNAAVYIVSQALYTVGYGDVPTSSSNMQRSFTTLMMLVGAFSFAMVIAVMSSVIANQDILYVDFRQKLEIVNEYMTFRGLPDDLQRKLVNHFDYLFDTQYGKLEIQVLDELPNALKTEVLMLNEYLVKNHPFVLYTKDRFFSGELMKILIPRTYSPNEIVVFRHSPIACMFFIRFGKINILAQDDQSTVTSLLAGEHFGGFEFFFDLLYEHTLKTGTFTELLVLEREHFDKMLSNPRFADIKEDIEATVTTFCKFLNQGLLGIGDAKFKSTRNKTKGGKNASSSGDGDSVEDDAIVEKKEKENAAAALAEAKKLADDESAKSPTIPDRNNRRTFSPKRSPASRAKKPALRSKEDVFPTYFINKLKKEFEEAEKVDEEMTENECPYATTESGYHRGVTALLLDWWKQRNSVNEQIHIFSSNMSKKKKFADMLNDKEDEELILMPDYFVILADSRLRMVWDSVSFVLAVYLSIMIPQRLHDSTEATNSVLTDELGSLLPLDWVCDFFFVLDIILHARVFALTEINEQGKTIHITERDQMLAEYFRNDHMVRDLLTFFPYDLFGLAIGSFNALRVPKLLIAFRLPGILTQLKVHLAKSYKVHLSLDNMLVVNLLVSTILFTHWISSMWAILQIIDEVAAGDSRYISSVYWALTTLTTVGFGDLTPTTYASRWFAVFTMILGSCFTAAVIANITSMAHKVVISEDNAQHVMTCVEKYMVEKGLPHDIRERCIRYFYMLKNDINEEKILREQIPPPFIPDIAMHVYEEIISSTPMFESINVSIGLIRSVAMLLREEVVVEQDWVLKDNPVHDKWYYIKSGAIHILDMIRSNEVLHTVSQKGGILTFGEASLFYPQGSDMRSPYNARTVSNCILISLEPKLFQSLETKYETEFDKMRDFIAQVEAEANELYESGRISGMRSGIVSTLRSNVGLLNLPEAGIEGLAGGGQRGSNNGAVKTRHVTMFGRKSVGAIGELAEQFHNMQDHHHLHHSTPFKRVLNAISGKIVLLPDSNFQLVWNHVVLSCLIYNVVVIPFRMAFSGGKYGNFTGTLAIDYLTDIIFVVDSALRLKSFAYLEGETVISDQSKIRDNYLKHFKADVLSVIPIELITLPIPAPPLSGVQVFSIFRALRLLRTRHMEEHIRCFDHFFFYVTSQRNKNSLKVFKLLSLMALSAHWVGCIWFFIAFIEMSSGLPNWADCSSSIETNHLFGCDATVAGLRNTTGEWAPVASQYIRSVYWASTALTTAGYGDVSATTQAEQGFSIFVLVIGTLIFATVIANLEEIVAQVDVTSTLFQQSVEEVQAFMKMRVIPTHIQEEIGKYHDTLWLKQKGASESSILSYLPGRVKHEVLKFHVFKTIKDAPVFKQMTLTFLNNILDELDSDFFLNDTVVWDKGECGFEVYFLTRGNVDLMDGKNKLFSVGMGGLLGEGEFFARCPRSTTAIASTYTTAFFLQYESLQKLLDGDPKNDEIFQKYLVESKAEYDVNEKVEKMRKNLKAGGKMAQMLMLDTNDASDKPLVFLPDSLFRRYWDILCMIIMLMNFFSVPVRIAFYEQDTPSMGEPAWLALNVVLDMIFFMDIVLNLRYFAVVYEGLLISDRAEFSELYKQGRLKWDVIACLPVDSVLYLAGIPLIRTYALFRLTRALHLFRFPDNIQSLVDLCEEKGIRAKSGIWHCCRMVIFVLMSTHWCACIFYYVAVLQGLNATNSWTADLPLNATDIRMNEKYSTSVYWSMYTITLVGYGDITLKSNAEMLFSIFTMLTGTILCDAGITAILSSIVHTMDASAGEAQAWVQVITKYMRHRSLPLDLQDRIFGFFVHMHLSDDDIDEFKVLAQQPRYIKHKLLDSICFMTMRNNFAPLEKYSDGFLKSVIHGMYPYLALPKEILLAVHTPCDKVYVVVRGKINVLTASRKKFLVTDTLDRGEVVGNFRESEVTYRTVSYSELYCLPLEHYSHCFSYVTNDKEAALLDKKSKNKNKMLSETSSGFGGSFRSKLLDSKAFSRIRKSSSRLPTMLPTIEPNTDFRKAWNLVCLFFAIYLSFSVPLEVFVIPDYKFFASDADSGTLAINVIDILIDFFFVADVFCRMFVFDDFGAGERNAEGEEETIFWLYLDHSLFWFDILSSIPLEHIASINSDRGTAAYRVIKLLRVARMPYYTSYLLNLLEERRILTHIGLQRMWNLFFISALGGHWAGCVFVHVSTCDTETRADQLAEYFSSHNGTFEESLIQYCSIPDSIVTPLPPTWIEIDGLVCFSFTDVGNSTFGAEVAKQNPLLEIYIRGLYWAYVTMITTGFGDITPSTTSETLMCIITMYVGVIVTCSAIANLTLLVSNFDQASNEFHQKLDNVNKYLTYQQVPAQLGNKIRQYYEYQWTVLKGVDEAQFLKELTPQLQQAFQEQLIEDYLMNVDILRRAPKSLVTTMLQVDVMEKVSLSPGDLLCQKGTSCKGLYVLIQGVAEVLKGKGTASIGFTDVKIDKDVIESTMRKGEVTFGIFLLKELPVPSTIRAKSYCEFLFMRRDKFQRIVVQHCNKDEIDTMQKTGLKSLENATKLKRFLGGAEDITMSGWVNRFLPGTKARRRWDVMSALVGFYYSIEIPLHISFCFSDVNVGFLVSSIIVDVFYAIDLVMHASYFPYRDAKSGLLVFDRTEVLAHFRSNHGLFIMVYDALTCVPLEILVLAGVLPSTSLPILRLLKFNRLMEVPAALSELENDFSEMLKNIENSTKRFVKLNLGMVIACHFTGCVWYFIGTFAQQHAKEDNWIDRDQNEYLDHDDLYGMGWYLRSFYFALVGMSTVGYGDIVPVSISETVIAGIIILFGGLVLPAVVGGLASLMGNMNANLAQFRRKMDNLNIYMLEHRFPRTLQERIKNYYNYLWTRLGGKSDREGELFDLPKSLKDELSSCIKGPILAQVEFLDNMNAEIMKAIRASLRPQIFLPGDVIIKAGEYGEEMYLIERGKIFVTSEDRKVIFAVLERGDYFGESSLLTGEKRIATVFSPGYCDCLVFTKVAFDKIMTEFPIQKNILVRQIQKELGKKTKTDTAVEKNLKSHEKLLSTQTKEESSDIHFDTKITKAHPDSGWRIFWGVILLLVVLWYSFKIPFQIAFAYSLTPTFFVVDYVLDFLFLSDIYLRCKVFAYNDGGKLVQDSCDITSHYFRTDFKKDAFASFPYEIFGVLLAMLLPEGHQSEMVVALAWCRLPKLLRVFDLKIYASVLEKVLVEVGMSRGNNGVKLIKLLVVVVIIGHFAACFFFLSAFSRNDNWETCDGLPDDDGNGTFVFMGLVSEFSMCKWDGTWVQLQVEDDKVEGHGDAIDFYIRAFNWALPTLVVVVIGDVIPLTSNETLYCLMWMLVGVTVNASIVGNIASIVANLETESSLFIKRADTLQDYLHQHGLPQHIQERARKYLDWLWSERRGKNQDTILHELPFTLRAEVSNLSRLSYVRSCEFFKHLPENLVEAIAMSFKSHLYSVHDQIVSVGDESFELFYIEKGGVEVILSDNKTVCAKIDAGNFFGESALFHSGHRMANIRAADFCELLSLHRIDFGKIFKNFEDEKQKVLEVFHSMQKRNKKRNDTVEEELKRKMSLVMHMMPHNSHGGFGLQDISTGEGFFVRLLRSLETSFCQHSHKRVLWELLGMLNLLYLMVFVPLRLGFYLDEEDGFSSLDYFVELYYLCDIILRSYFFNNDVAQDEAGNVIEANFKQRTKVEVSYEQVKDGGVKTVFACEIEGRKEYRNFLLYFDLLAVTPVDLFILLSPSIDKTSPLAMSLRLIHLVRIHRFFDYIKTFEGFLYHIRIRVSADIIQLSKVMMTYVLINHFYSCMWMCIHRYLESDVEFTWATVDKISSWDPDEGKHDVCTNKDIERCYVRAFHFVITTISSVGYGDIYPTTQLETIFEWVVVVSGAALVASLIGSFVSFFQGQDSSGQSAFKMKLNLIQEYMIYKDLPEMLCTRILKHHRAVYAQQKTIDVTTVMSDLPRPLQMEIAMFINRQIIHKVPLLRDCSVTIQKTIALAIRPQFIEMYSFVYQQGDIGDAVYFILKGNILLHQGRDVSKLDRKNRERQRRVSVQEGLKDGGSFGEDVIVSKTGVRVESARALINSNLYTLSKGEIENIMSMLGPGARVMFLERLLKRDLDYEDEDDDDDEGGEDPDMFGGDEAADLSGSSLPLKKARGEKYDANAEMSSRNTMFSESLSGKMLKKTRRRDRLSSNDHETNLESPNSILHTPNREGLGGGRRRTNVTKVGEAKKLFDEENPVLDVGGRRMSKVIEADPKLLRKQFAKKMMSAQSEKNFMLTHGLSFGDDEKDEEEEFWGKKAGDGLGEDGKIVEGSEETLDNNFMNMMVQKRFTNIDKVQGRQESFKLKTKGGLGIIADVLKEEDEEGEEEVKVEDKGGE